jgi:predicted NAD/FAD-binding protein
MKRVAIIGSGISGISSAYYLNQLGYEISLFESAHYFGGHTNTVDIEVDEKTMPIDTGFLVHNDRTYPNLIDFFKELNIETHNSDMSFSVVKKSDNLVWSGTNLFTVFTQSKNLFSLRFWKFLREVLRFNKNAKNYLEESKKDLSKELGELLNQKGYSEDFRKWYLLPMGGCIWSTPTSEMLKFPAYTFLIFCMNHGLLQIFNRPQWKTVSKGCRTYVEKSLNNIKNKYLNESVINIDYKENKVIIKTGKRTEFFDYCVMATHPPETLKIIKNIELESKTALEKFLYQPNEAVLHLDEKILPEKKKAWAAWNYLSATNSDENEAVSVSYLINMLQPINTEKSVLVTLNPVTKINEDKVIRRFNYQHPVFSANAIAAQREVEKLQGEKGIFFTGAWMRYGFHEDGILSAKKVINEILQKDEREDKQLSIK